MQKVVQSAYCANDFVEALTCQASLREFMVNQAADIAYSEGHS